MNIKFDRLLIYWCVFLVTYFFVGIIYFCSAWIQENIHGRSQINVAILLLSLMLALIFNLVISLIEDK